MMHKSLVSKGRLSRVWPIDDRSVERTDDGPAALLRAMAAIAYKHKGKLLIWTLLCAMSAAFYARSRDPVFTATASLLLEPRRQAVTSAREVAAPATLDLSRADSEIQVIRSERLLTKVFNNLELASHPELQPRPPGLLRRLISRVTGKLPDTPEPAQPAGTTDMRAGAASRAELRQIAFANFTGRISTRRVGQSYVIEISYVSSDPELTARVANSAASAYLLQSVGAKADAAASGAEFLQQRLDALSAQVKAATEAVREGSLPTLPTPDADARIIGAALVPLGPSGPGTSLIVIFGAALGLMTGFLTLAIASLFDRRVPNGEVLQRETGLPCLARIPDVGGWSWRRRHDRLDMERLAVSDDDTGFGAAIRDLRTAIDIIAPANSNDGHRIIALCSAKPGAGNTLLAMNLAHLISQSGRRVTVIHGKRTWPPLGLNDPSAAASIVDALAEWGAPPDKIAFFDLDGIAMLPVHSSNPQRNRVADLCSPVVARILAHACKKGDVLLDLPALSTSAEGLALAKHADAVILTVAAGRNSVEEIDAAARALSRVDANVIGAVVNHVGR